MLSTLTAWLVIALLALRVAWAVLRQPAPSAPRRTIGQVARWLLARFPRWKLLLRPVVRLAAWVNRRVPLGALDLGLALLIGLISFGAWSFAEALEGVTDREELYAVDTWLERWIYAERLPPATALAAWVSAVTRPLGVGIVLTAAALALLAKRRLGEAGGLVLAAVGTGILTMLAKDVTARPRPLGNADWAHASMAFPSGHTSGTAAVSLFLAWLLTRHLPPARRARAYAAAVAITGAVALSRVYLVVHWLSDVLGGAALAFGWTALCILATRAWLDRRHRHAAAPAMG